MTCPSVVRYTTVLLILTLVACQSRQAEEQPLSDVASVQEEDTGAPVVQLERDACFGTCPVYTVQLFADGRVEFDGRAHVAQMGTQSGAVSPDSVRALVQRLTASGFLREDRAYEEGAPGCGDYFTDAPRLTLTLRSGNSSTTVRFDGGCSSAPRDLSMLATDVDRIADTRVWIEGTGGPS